MANYLGLANFSQGSKCDEFLVRIGLFDMRMSILTRMIFDTQNCDVALSVVILQAVFVVGMQIALEFAQVDSTIITPKFASGLQAIRNNPEVRRVVIERRSFICMHWKFRKQRAAILIKILF